MPADMFYAASPMLLLACFLGAALYSSVGHGGASAYLAIMGLWGMAPAEMKPVALLLNIAVSLVAVCSFARVGHFQGRLFWPLVAASMPAAFVGGWMQTSDPVFKFILAAALVFGAWRLCSGKTLEAQPLRTPHAAALLWLGLVIGFLSGLIGIGGGIFLTPILILAGWAAAKPAAAVSAAFIFANSLSGLGGFFSKGGAMPELAWMLLPAALVGGLLGSFWGSSSAPNLVLRRILASVLAVAAAKFVIP